jgi:hypothetical protein
LKVKDVSQASLKSLVHDFVAKDRDKTFAELYEEMHDVMALRAKVSNSLMVIGLKSANASAKNLKIYLSDAETLCKAATDALLYMADSPAKYNAVSKLFKDMLEESIPKCAGTDRADYQRKFQQTWNLFKRIEKGERTTPDQLNRAKVFLLRLDKDIEQAYLKEEALYFGYLRSAKPSR